MRTINNILITGADGFIGTNLKSILKFYCNKIVSIDINPKEKNTYNIDVRDYEKIKSICETEEIDAIIHLAADSGVQPSLESPIYNFDVNCCGTLSCLEAARNTNVKRVIFASSGGTVLGHQSPPAHEEVPAKPTSPYGASKVAGEAYCKAYSSSFDLDTVILRFSNIFGPHCLHKKKNLVPNLLNSLINNEIVTLYGNGEQSRDFCHVNNILFGILRVLFSLKNHNGEIYQLGSGQKMKIKNLVYMFNLYAYNILEKDIKYVFESYLPDGDIEDNYVLIDKAKNQLNWNPYVDLETGILWTIRWLEEEYGGKKILCNKQRFK